MKNTGSALQGKKQVVLSDGNEYTIFFSINAFINLEKKYGSLPKVYEQMSGENISFAVFLDFLYEGIRSTHKDITKEEVGDLISIGEFQKLASDVFGVVEDDLPSDNEKQ